MGIKKIIQDELDFANNEYQLKIKARIREKDIYKLGAKKLGTVHHEDKYFVLKGNRMDGRNELIRLRKEGETDLLFTYKASVDNKKIRHKLIANKVLSKPAEKRELLSLKKDCEEIISVNKKRTIFLLDSVLINLDHVENLGDFIEFKVQNEKDFYLVDSLVKRLGLDYRDLTSLSYFELALMNMSPFQRILIKIHDKFGKFSFGISSAVLTTLGIIVGLNSATESLITIIAGIVSVAIADSLSDSIGMYASKKTERGVSSSNAFRSALNVFLGKFIFTLTFIVPFLFLPLTLAIYACVVWGLILLAFVNVQIAFLEEESIPKTVVKNLFIAVFVMIVSYFAGNAVSLLS